MFKPIMALCVAGIFTLLLTAVNPARAAVMLPESHVKLFGEGYGVVEAVAVKDVPDASKDSNQHTITFEISSILAQPVKGDKLPLKAGDKIDLNLYVGYGGLIQLLERPAIIKPGEKFYLTIRYDKEAKHYEHASGSSSVISIGVAGAMDKEEILFKHTLAELSPSDRLAKCERILRDTKEELKWRQIAIGELFRMVKDKELNPDQIKTLARSTLELFEAADLNTPSELITVCDFILSEADAEFAASDKRVEVWTKFLFTPLPQEGGDWQKRTVDRFENNFWFFSKLVELQPDKVGQVLMKNMKDDKWPVQMRWRSAAILQTAYTHEKKERPEWADALREIYPNLINKANAWTLRFISHTVSRSGETDQWTLRPMLWNDATREALESALKRMQADLATGKADAETQSAVKELGDALKALQDMKELKDRKYPADPPEPPAPQREFPAPETGV